MTASAEECDCVRAIAGIAFTVMLGPSNAAFIGANVHDRAVLSGPYAAIMYFQAECFSLNAVVDPHLSCRWPAGCCDRWVHSHRTGLRTLVRQRHDRDCAGWRTAVGLIMMLAPVKQEMTEEEPVS